MSFIKAFTGLVLFIFSLILIFAVFVVPFVLAWYVCSVLLVTGVVWWAVYLFVFIIVAAVIKWGMEIILNINGDDGS